MQLINEWIKNRIYHMSYLSHTNYFIYHIPTAYLKMNGLDKIFNEGDMAVFFLFFLYRLFLIGTRIFYF